MDECQNEMQHFILTRFSILLWKKDKEGFSVRTEEWLEHRFSLFESYCLPSIKSQTNQNFEWIILFDSKTPKRFRDRIEDYKRLCPQLVPVFVEPGNGPRFADVFRAEIIKRLRTRRVISTYLDNDDALHLSFVEDLQCRAIEEKDSTFFFYDNGYQYYVDYKYLE